MQVIAGLEKSTSGESCIVYQMVSHLTPKDCDAAEVFQNLGLCFYLSLFEKICLSLCASAR